MRSLLVLILPIGMAVGAIGCFVSLVGGHPVVSALFFVVLVSSIAAATVLGRDQK
jgi:hypothetical protein